jgi:hypothetical protein
MVLVSTGTLLPCPTIPKRIIYWNYRIVKLFPLLTDSDEEERIGDENSGDNMNFN